MAFSNNMTKLVDKIERRIGATQLNLPDHLKKDKWPQIIIDDTLTTFSRYFPHEFPFLINQTTTKIKDGYYLIDEDIVDGIEIYGVRDLDFSSLTGNGIIQQNAIGGYYDYFNLGPSYEDIVMQQMRADQMSLIDRNVYIDFIPPNRLSVKGANNQDILSPFSDFKIKLLIKHADNLSTIEPTKMETFEKLAIIDIKIFLYSELKYYNDLETVFASTNLRIDEWASSNDDRENFIEKLNEVYVSAANKNQPILISIGG